MAKLNKDGALVNILKGSVKSKLSILAHGPDLCRHHLLRIVAQHCSSEPIHLITLDSFDLSPVFVNPNVVEHRLHLLPDAPKQAQPLFDAIGLDPTRVNQFPLQTAVIDSFDPLLMHFSLPQLTLFIDCIKQNYKRIVCTLSADLPTDRQLILLREKASSYVRLERLPPFSAHTFRMRMLHKRPSSKIRFEIHEFERRVRLQVNRSPTVEVLPDSADAQLSCTETTDLPFELTLTEDDSSSDNKQKRKEHVLPYIR
jgi:hypothetical protein